MFPNAITRVPIQLIIRRNLSILNLTSATTAGSSSRYQSLMVTRSRLQIKCGCSYTTDYNAVKRKPLIPASLFSTSSSYYNSKIPLEPAIITSKSIQNSNTEEVNFSDSENSSKDPSFPSETSPKLYLSFTCKVCSNSNSYMISKQAYNHGVVIVTCSSCSSNHLIADHINWFEDIEGKNIEEIMALKGEKVTKFLSKDVTEITQKD